LFELHKRHLLGSHGPTVVNHLDRKGLDFLRLCPSVLDSEYNQQYLARHMDHLNQCTIPCAYLPHWSIDEFRKIDNEEFFQLNFALGIFKSVSLSNILKNIERDYPPEYCNLTYGQILRLDQQAFEQAMIDLHTPDIEIAENKRKASPKLPMQSFFANKRSRTTSNNDSSNKVILESDDTTGQTTQGQKRQRAAIEEFII